MGINPGSIAKGALSGNVGLSAGLSIGGRIDPQTAARNVRLDTLTDSIKDWSSKKKASLNVQVSRSKQIQAGASAGLMMKFSIGAVSSLTVGAVAGFAAGIKESLPSLPSLPSSPHL